MKRNLSLLFLFAIVVLIGACGDDKTVNGNLRQNMNANNVPSNVGVLVNDNGNKNTAGVRAINGNTSVNQNGTINASNSNRY